MGSRTDCPPTRRIEGEIPRGDDPFFHQQVAGAVHDMLRRSQIANSPARRAESGQPDSVSLAEALHVSCVAIRLADGLGKIPRSLHGASHNRKDDLCSTAFVQQRLRQFEPIAAESIELCIVEESEHLLEIDPEWHRIVNEPPRRTGNDRLRLGICICELNSGARAFTERLMP